MHFEVKGPGSSRHFELFFLLFGYRLRRLLIRIWSLVFQLAAFKVDRRIRSTPTVTAEAIISGFK